MQFPTSLIPFLPLLGLTTAIPVTPGGPSGHEVQIESINYAGSGCFPGTAVGTIDNTGRTMTISYSDFIAQSGVGIRPRENRKNCNLTIKLRYPGGWQYSVFSTSFRGYANIFAGDRGVCKATYWFSGETENGARTLNLPGPYDGNYLLSDQIPLDTVTWSPCGRQGLLNINSEVRVVPVGTSNVNLMTVDATDARFDQIVYFQWQSCNQTAKA